MRGRIGSTCLGLAVLGALASAAAADSWMAPVAERFVDSAGEYHVVVSPAGRFVYARRAAGADPVTHLRDEDGGWKEDRTIAIRDGDTVLARGKLPHRPMDVLVSARGRGFAAIDHYANLGYGSVVVVADAAGRITHEKTLDDLFPKLGTDGFTHSVSSIWWREGAWMDDERDAAVIVAAGGHVRIVALADGSVREGGPEDIVRALAHPSAAARDLALDLVREKKIAGVRAALERLLADESGALSTRLRVATVLAERGDAGGRDVVVAAARVPCPEGVSAEDHAYAVANLAVVLGEEALPLLRDAMRGPAGAAWHPAQLAFASLGEKAVPTLLEMLAETGESPDYRGGAAHALGSIGSRRALDGLLAAVGDPDGYTANAAANAAIAIGGDDCAPALLAHLRRGCTQDGRIAGYFGRVKHADAVPALADVLERAGKDDYLHRCVLDALRFQTGADLGDDPAAWRKWSAEHER